MPKSSTPALLLTTVRSLVPLRRTAPIRFSGMPQSPKPPIRMVMPSRRLATAASADATRLSTRVPQWSLPQMPESRKLPSNSKAAQKLVEFVGGIEVGFEFAGTEALAQIVDAAGKQIERGRENLTIGKHNVAPGCIGAPGKAQRIAKARPCESDRQTVFVEPVVQKRTQGHGGELRKMRGQTDGIVVLLRAEPDRACPNLFQNFDERSDAWVVRILGFTNQRVRGALKKVRIGVREAGKLAPSHGVSAKKNGPDLFDKQLRSSLADAHFGAAHVGDQSVWRRVMCDLRKNVERVSDGKGDVDQVGPPDRRFERFEESFVERPAFARLQNDLRAVPSEDGDFGCVPAKRAGE